MNPRYEPFLVFRSQNCTDMGPFGTLFPGSLRHIVLLEDTKVLLVITKPSQWWHMSLLFFV